MNVAAAIATIDEAQTDEGSVGAASKLSAMERIFCDVFVANGGNAAAAVIEAGYPEASATVQGCRLLCRKRVADYLTELAMRFAHTALPIAIRTLVEIASDPQALRKDRIKAATSLMEHGGMAAPKGGVQVNVGVAVNGQQAQALIGSVWEAKQARLSDIPPAMSDTMKQLESDVEALATPLDGDHPGGDHLQGPAAGTCPLPGYSSAKPVKPAVSGPGPSNYRQAAWEAARSRHTCECEQCHDVEAPVDAADGFDAFMKGFDDDDTGV